MALLLYILGVVAMNAGLVIFAYVDRIYRELGRMTAGRLRQNLEVFEAELEPRLKLERRPAAVTFALLAQFWLVLSAVQTSRGVSFFVAGTWEALLELIFIITLEVVLCVHFLPYVLLTRTTGRWLGPMIPVMRLFTWAVWPLRATLDVFVSLAHLSDEEEDVAARRRAEQERLEALVEVAEEEGLLKRDQAELFEQMVEFSDKRVREVMTPRPNVVAIPASATIEQLRRVLVETKYSRIPVYETSLDDIIGIAFARDILQIPESDAATRSVREIMRPPLFVPETKLGSQLLKEMQQKRQQIAIAVDEYGSVAGLVTAEDLVEEIVGELFEEDRSPVPDVVREGEGNLVLRGSVPVEKLEDLLGAEIGRTARDAGSTTVAGLLNALAGHVPRPGEVVDYDGLRFEVLEANQRKVLRLRVRRQPASTAATP